MATTLTDQPVTRTEPGPPEPRVGALDGLRGVAILLVLVSHIGAVLLDRTTTGLDGAVRAMTRGGWTGVILFFVLSGYLITGILLDTKDRPRWWPNFFARRALRIFPVYYGVLFGLFVVVPRLVHWTDADFLTLQRNQAWYWGYSVNLLTWLTHGSGAPLYTGHFWSLAVEEQFYLLWPLIVWLCRPRTLLAVAVAVVGIGLAARLSLVPIRALDITAIGLSAPRMTQTIAAMLLSSLDGLMAGAMVAILARGDGGLSRLRRPAAWTLGVSAVLLAAIVTWRGTLEGDDNVIFVAGVPLMALVYAGLMVTALTAPAGTRLHDVLVNRSLRNWGRYSYGIYVFHYPIVGAAGMKLGFVIAGTAGLIGSRLPGVALLGALAAAVSYGMALASYHLYEKPFLQLKRYFVTSGRPEPC